MLFASSISQLFNSDYNTRLGPLYSYSSGDLMSENKILMLNIEGVILSQRPEDPFTAILNGEAVYGYEVKQELINASEDPTIKGIILFVNSPGGTINGSRAIADGIDYYQEITGNQVVAIGSGMVASGAYWAIANTDKIYLDPGSMIGSIGVIFGPITNYNNVISNQDVLTTDGISEEYITSGKGKDLGNPYRDITSEERSVLQKSVDNSYNDFVDWIASSRGIEANVIKNNIGAYVYDEDQALSYKLIDESLNVNSAMYDFIESLNLGDDYQIVTKEKEVSFLGALLSSATMIESSKNVCSNLESALVIEENFLRACN